jgi:hypothetical protein
MGVGGQRHAPSVERQNTVGEFLYKMSLAEFADMKENFGNRIIY